MSRDQNFSGFWNYTENNGTTQRSKYIGSLDDTKKMVWKVNIFPQKIDGTPLK